MNFIVQSLLSILSLNYGLNVAWTSHNFNFKSRNIWGSASFAKFISRKNSVFRHICLYFFLYFSVFSLLFCLYFFCISLELQWEACVLRIDWKIIAFPATSLCRDRLITLSQMNAHSLKLRHWWSLNCFFCFNEFIDS